MTARQTLASVIGYALMSIMFSYLENYIAAVLCTGIECLAILMFRQAEEYKAMSDLAKEAIAGWKRALELP